MITNLKAKLAAISAQAQSTTITDEKPQVLDFACSVYEDSFDKSHMIGDTPLGDIFSKNISSLLDVCFCQSDDKIELSDIVFFDTETTGLSTGTSTTAFLIGTGYFDGDRFICKQFLMNDYHQESDMLQSLNNILTNHKAVVSYNGKAYDRHIVNTRSILNRLPRMLDDKLQLDLLHSARRLYKRRLPSCSMGSIEENILNLKRVDDIPGSEIPDIFFNYIKYKDSSQLSKVVEHNLQDIISMVAIAAKLIDAYDEPCGLEYDMDIFSQGVIFEKLNFPQKAILCYNNLENYPPAVSRLGYIAKSLGDYTNAIKSFSKLSKMMRFDTTGNIEMAKIYEHKLGDAKSAMEQTILALQKVSSSLFAPSMDTLDDIKKRKERLATKLSKIGRN